MGSIRHESLQLLFHAQPVLMDPDELEQMALLESPESEDSADSDSGVKEESSPPQPPVVNS